MASNSALDLDIVPHFFLALILAASRLSVDVVVSQGGVDLLVVIDDLLTQGLTQSR